MNFKEIGLKKAYSSDFDDILFDFYIPVLEASVEYKRLAGFFSSATLAMAARGISGLIKNGGYFKLIVSPYLNKEDLGVIINSHEEPKKYIERKMLNELENLENEFIRDHVYALGWLLANKKLEIKVAIAYNNEGNPLSYESLQENGLFHQKVGILKDSEGNIVTFSGSINETVTGWFGNIEEFKVFRSWEPSEQDYIDADISKFERFWNNLSQKIRILDIPQAVKNKLISLAPEEIENINLAKWIKRSRKKMIKLFDYQREAVESWCQNNMRGIFEMATGTGKTFTALACINRAYNVASRLLVIITCPYQHLVQQWKREIDKFGIKFDDLIIADSSNPQWRKRMKEALIDLSLEYKQKIIILTTHSTFSSNDFIKIFQEGSNDKFDIFLIGDEIHGLGAEKRSRGFLKEYNMRLGLSATPKRWFDSVGTNVIYEFFDKVVYEFGLKEAISTINPSTGETYLTPYYYIPKFVSLSSEELEEYIIETKKIIGRFNDVADDKEKDEILELLLFKRANIIKNAQEKYRILENILNEIGPSIKWTLVYASPQQIDKIMKIIDDRSIIVHRFTMEEGTTPNALYGGLSERDFLLQEFTRGKYQILVAIKCLDEGVDIPPVRIAILMSSSGNPREYIQRIGRIIRRYPGKNESVIYDIVVVPSFNNLPQQLSDIEWKIFERELKRYREISSIAINNAEALSLVNDLENKLLEEKNERRKN
jgi:superfamily II DNA or RNA helicase